MAKPIVLEQYLDMDSLGCYIADKWMVWNQDRTAQLDKWREIREYVYATDTSTTTNSQLPWKNKTTIPKLCQIRDNLFANYQSSLFPKKKWLVWEPNSQSAANRDKTEAIEDFMSYVLEQPRFNEEFDKLLLDYIDYGNVFGTVAWEDETTVTPDKTQVGYIGPVIRRIDPSNLVFNPTATSFVSSPKIERSLITIGDVKDYLTRLSTENTKDYYESLFNYLKEYRTNLSSSVGEITSMESYLNIDGFSNFREYIESNSVELLTFYGDIYDEEKDEYLRNYRIVVVDRHKIIDKRPDPSFFGQAPIYSVGWRKRQESLWAMGPLDNLVGMQYRIDHLENLKADVLDLIAYPVLKIKGDVEDFEWKPMEKILMGDEGDVEMVSPPFQVIQLDQEIMYYQSLMEELAGAPKEAMGIRSPGEKTKYEVQRLENAASRIFQSKIKQFEIYFVEPLMNALLELARRMLNGPLEIRVFDDTFKTNTFKSLTVTDITGSGRIKPMAARHFAEQAEMVQNLNGLTNSGIWQKIQPHFSSIKMAEMYEHLFELESYEIVVPYIAISEQADATRIAQSHEEQVLMETQTATGLGNDFDLPENQSAGPQTPSPLV